jgi:pimeloyl-ACP methyl ester carboxylesterase
MAPIRVLFIHGLESSPKGTKVRVLREQGFDVIAPDMHMGLLQLQRRNSALRQVLRLRETRLIGASVLTATAMGQPVVAGALALIFFLSRRRVLFARALARSFETCVEIQRQAVAREKPDIVVGSSWGGAVAAELILRGAWSGPTVLLAPAIQKVSAWTSKDASQKVVGLRERSAEVPMIVFHDPSDETIAHADSVELSRDSRIDFRSVSAGGHRLMDLLDRGELKTAIEQLVRGAQAA